MFRNHRVYKKTVLLNSLNLTSFGFGFFWVKYKQISPSLYNTLSIYIQPNASELQFPLQLIGLCILSSMSFHNLTRFAFSPNILKLFSSPPNSHTTGLPLTRLKALAGAPDSAVWPLLKYKNSNPVCINIELQRWRRVGRHQLSPSVSLSLSLAVWNFS